MAILVGLALRLHGLNWDQGFMFHPDERAILMKVEGGLSLPMPINFGQLLDPKTSPLNPHWFPYGTLPLYILKLAGHVLSFIKESYASHDLRLVGRAISAVFDVGTIFLVYVIGRRIYDRRVGVLGAIFVSLSVIDIQLSHFYAVDVMLAFLITLTIYFCVNLAERRRDRDVVMVGLCLGLSFAVKVSTAPILVPVLAALVLSRRGQVLGRLLAILVVAAVAFFLAAPFSILDHDAFLASVTEQSGMVRRILDYPYTRQYIDTPAYLYHIVQLGRWGLGPALGIVAWSGLAFATLLALVRRRRGDILLLSWVLPYFAITGAFEVKFLRYLLPIVPILCLMGARLLFSLRDFSPHLGSKARTIANVAIGIVVAATAFYALAYMNVYSLPHPAVRMAEWINANVPKGTMILKEHWEEGIPNLGAYRGGDLNLYENDDANKLNHSVTQVRSGDYVVFFSNRLYGTIPRLPERYPLTSRYYD
ncbi:MAG: glycosyltransferase family 39 protein, partial [Dehalococcoidia bacterium]|nr:glycosyltransferase family 39 protein [Dehalococcoidia bacterium]